MELSVVPYKNEHKWSTWVELLIEYRQSLKIVNNYIVSNNDSEYKAGDLEILKDSRNNIEEMIKELRLRTLTEYKSIREEDLNNPLLTERQRQIARMRQIYNCTEVARMLGLSPKTVFTVYKRTIDKICKMRLKESANLSGQQDAIWRLKKEGLSDREIAERLNTTYGNVRKQLSCIRKKLPEQWENC